MKKHMLAKRMGAIALCAVLSTGLLSATAAAQGKDVTAYLSPDLSIVVDGSYRTFYNAVGQEVHPILYGGTTYPVSYTHLDVYKRQGPGTPPYANFFRGLKRLTPVLSPHREHRARNCLPGSGES